LPTPSAGGPTAAPQSEATTLPGASTSEFGQEEYGHEQHHEEPAVIGWGGDEDEDGMGML